MTTTLVSFLGTGDYAATVYDWPGVGQARRGSYVCAALAEIARPSVIDIIATDAARKKHESGLRTALAAIGAPEPQFHAIPRGRNEQELWQQFQILIERIGCDDAGAPEQVLLDITHSFRAQPFFAGAVIGLLQAIDRQPDLLRVVYGEYRQDEEISPVWSLDLVVELAEWAQALGLFLNTGVAGPVVELGQRIRRVQAEQAQAAGSGDFPGFDRLVKAIDALAADLTTIRVAALITGYEQDEAKKAGAVGSARRLIEAIDAQRQEVARRLPPLALVLDRLRQTVLPLIAETLYSPQGHSAQQALAAWYLALQRYPEAAITVREALVSTHAAGRQAVEINHPHFSHAARQQADRAFARSGNQARAMADIRNDIEHGGYRNQPLSASVLKERIGDMVEKLKDTPWPERPAAAQTGRGRTVLLSRHPGARQWMAQQGIEPDEHIEHLDPAQISPGDTVIGTFPVHLAAELCRRGARVVFLSIDLPPKWRGRELSAEELAACNPRLEEFQVQRLGPFAPVSTSAHTGHRPHKDDVERHE